MTFVPEVSVGDIQDYLASLQPDQSAAVPNNGYDCLVGSTLAWKHGTDPNVFPVRKFFVWPEYITWEGKRYPLHATVTAITDKFDAIEERKSYFLTRDEVYEHFPELRKGKEWQSKQ